MTEGGWGEMKGACRWHVNLTDRGGGCTPPPPLFIDVPLNRH